MLLTSSSKMEEVQEDSQTDVVNLVILSIATAFTGNQAASGSLTCRPEVVPVHQSRFLGVLGTVGDHHQYPTNSAQETSLKTRDPRCRRATHLERGQKIV